MKKHINYFCCFLSLILMPIRLSSFYQEIDTVIIDDNYKNLETFELLKSKAIYDVENNNDEFDKPYILISLGCNCECAYQLSQRKLSGAFFPFDWIRTEDFNQIGIMIEQNFRDFLNKKNLVVGQRNSTTSPTRLISDTKYNMKFVHDFPWEKELEESYDSVKQKYDRRIARFYRALLTNKPIYFFRRDLVTKAQAIKFCNVMYKKFPGLKFTLIIMHNSTECKKEWGIKNVRNFFYKSPETKKFKWTGYYNKPWDEVLTNLDISWTENLNVN